MGMRREPDGEYGEIDETGAGLPGGATDAGVNDVMFDLGGDERRMHVRAYNHWVSLLRGRPYPTIADLDPGSIADFGPHSVLLDFRTDPGTGADRDAAAMMTIDDPRIAYLGAKLREECGLVGPITSIADVPSRSLLSRLTDHYLQIIANRAPIGFEAEFVNSRGRTTLYRGILMPFSSSDEGIDFLYGVINWKELADDRMQATLAAELEAAVRAAPVPASGLTAYARHAPTMPGLGASLASTGHAPATSPGVPIWADGPSAEFADPIAATGPTDGPAPDTLAHVVLRTDAEPGAIVLLVARAGVDGGLDIIGTITDDAALTAQAMAAIG